jgi:hypothetical protein
VPLSQLQKRIIELSLKIVAIDDFEEFNRTASELKSALREHAESLRSAIEEARNRLMGHGIPESRNKQ